MSTNKPTRPEANYALSQPLTIAEASAIRRANRCKRADSRAAQIGARILDAAPDSAPAMHLLALIHYRQGNVTAAIDRLRQAALADPHSAEMRNDLANLLQMSGSLDEAVLHYREALHLRPAYPEAHRNLASALHKLGRLSEAVTALETAVALNPAYAEAIAQLLHRMKQLCDWSKIDSLTGQLIVAVEGNTAPVNPFIFLSLDTTPAQQLQCARQWTATQVAARAAESSFPSPNQKITLGYLSADFQEHATAQLIAELFVLHDRSRFRVIGYSYGKDDGSTTRRRLAESFDSFVDLEETSHAGAAQRIRQDDVDILIDLKGYTTDARPEIAALRPARIQVNYLGYPGTMGSDAMDYILVDPFLVPFDQQPNFAEKLVHLPDCYQINDRRLPVASHTPTRTECGLPESGFVFCCLSACYKITPTMFDIWMRLLAAVPGSVLWLLESSAGATENLQREADARLADSAGRLVFAKSLPNPEHLARFAVADLFLDTLPYNAHTVSSDALWAGCPVVTCAGTTFASRVAGSILHAAGLPELVTTSLADYEALALRLARNSQELEELRAKVRSNRLSTALFDSLRWTRHAEAAFEEMWRLHQAGQPPRAFAVPRISDRTS